MSEQTGTGKDETTRKLVEAHHSMLERVRERLEHFGEELEEALRHAREKAVELGELTKEEAERIAERIRLDIRGEKLIQGYDRMLERVRERMENSGETLEQAIEHAREKAVELNELTREEAEKIGDYIRRDMQEAARYLAETGGELRDWLKFDLELVEERLLEAMLSVADKTTVELIQFREQLEEMAVYRTGEITGPGILECRNCGERLHFYHTGHIPPCPKCHGTEFRRISWLEE